MTVVVPTQSAAWYLYNQISTLTTLIAAATTTQPARGQYQVQLVALQRQLVNALMEHDAVPASAILSGLVFGQADTNVA